MKILNYRWLIIVVFTAAVILVGKNIPNNTIDGDVTNYIPHTMDSRVNTDKIEDIFGGTEITVIMFDTDDALNEETLKRVKSISREANRNKNVDKVMSLFDLKNIKGQDDMMIVDPAVKRIPRTSEKREVLRAELKDNAMVYETVISGDFTKTAVVLSLNVDADDVQLKADIDAMLLKYPGTEEVHIGGLPNIRATLPIMIAGQMKKLMPMAILLMLLMLALSFRRARGVILPFMVVIISIVFTLGLMPLFGFDITIISILIPIMLIAVANDYGIHIVSHYQELNTADNTKTSKEIVAETLKELWKPIAITGITTVAGLLGLLTHKVIPSRQMGIVTACGISFALLASLFLIPAIMSVLKKEKPLYKQENGKLHITDRLLQRLSHFVVSKPKSILIGTLIITIGLGCGLIRLGLDANPISFFKSNTEIRVTDAIMNDSFGGTQQFSILFSGDIKDPALLQRMDTYAAELETMDGVGAVTCISELIKEMSKALNNEGDALYDRIPDSREAVAQYLEMYMMSGDADDFEKLVDFNYENAQMLVRVNDASTHTLTRITDKIEVMKTNDESISMIGGFSLVVKELGEVMLSGQMSSIFLSLFIVFVLLSLMFKSVRAGLLGAVPLVVSIFTLFGLMGILNMKINMASAMLSSILIGVGIDYTIHFLWRYRTELRKNNNQYAQAITTTITTTGRGIVLNALSVIVGFMVLMVSYFVPIMQFGYLVVFSVFTCLLGAIIVVPALCLVWKPNFIER